MKRITFTKACKISPKYPKRLSRPNYPGYLFFHSNHPDREFVIARSSKTLNEDGSVWKFSKSWSLYDRKTGFNFNTKGNCSTREKRVETAVEWLHQVAPENIQAMIEKEQVKRLGAIINL